MSQLKPMDIYSSRMDIPFDAAVFCRRNRFSVQAVNFARAIREVQAADAKVTEAQLVADAAQEKMKNALLEVRKLMERVDGV